jgi:hypothetical protein
MQIYSPDLSVCNGQDSLVLLDAMPREQHSPYVSHAVHKAKQNTMQVIKQMNHSLCQSLCIQY